jgi:hypothetical protein
MKKITTFLLLFIISSTVLSQNIPVYHISIPKQEFKIASGMSLIGIGLSLQPVILNGSSRPFFHYPEITIPVTLGTSLVITGLIDGIKSERKKKNRNN